MKKIAIIGSRSFNDYSLLCATMSKYVPVDMVVSGGARGADSLGERWARENGIEVKVYPADWERFGKIAGYIRNHDIIRESDVVVAFWDGKSPGTRHSISLARKYGKELEVVRF